VEEEKFPLPKDDDVISYTNKYFHLLQAHHAPHLETLKCEAKKCKTHLMTGTALAATHLYMCEDCFCQRWYCGSCIVSNHEDNPLHSIRIWEPELKTMKLTSLHKLGLVVVLRHEDGTACNGGGKRRTLKVMHSNGIHLIAYKQCLCQFGEKCRKVRPTQLVANRLIPATHHEPGTAFTTAVLQFFDVLNLESATNVKQFCDTVHTLTPENYRLGEEVCYIFILGHLFCIT
jgi:hypothetical protein